MTVSITRCALALSIAFVAAPVAAQTVDEVIGRYIEAIGGREKIKALDNLVYSGGTYREADYQSDGGATMSRARPYFKLVGDKSDPGDYMEGYDGSAWEWFADPGVVIRTVGPASEAIRHYTGVEHPLVDYRTKGSTAKLLGAAELDGRPVQVVELTRRDGFVEQFYIDSESWLVVASGGAAPIHAFGETVQTLTRIADYRPIAGVLVPHRFVSVRMPSGEEVSSMQWGKIEGNRALPVDWFSPPSFERTPIQGFIEKLYEQRTDLDSIWWTYREFRRAHPQADTGDAVNFAGFQILKMGQVETAVALLEQNAKDYPHFADAHFGLGRAQRTAGRIAEARLSFRRALALDPEHRRAKVAVAEMSEASTSDERKSRSAKPLEQVEFNALLNDTQRQSNHMDRASMVWWLPEEFWRLSLEEGSGLTDEEVEEFLDFVRPYVMVCALDGDIGPMGDVTFAGPGELRENVVLVDAAGRRYTPLAEDAVSADAITVVELMKPGLAAALGPTGENMGFFFFPARTDDGDRIANATAAGTFTVEIRREVFGWRTPLGSLLAPRVCPSDGEELNGAWSYCPWHGRKLGE